MFVEFRMIDQEKKKSFVIHDLGYNRNLYDAVFMEYLEIQGFKENSGQFLKSGKFRKDLRIQKDHYTNQSKNSLT